MGHLKSALGLAGWLGITFSAAFVGSRYMPGEWYASLLKPSWNPPNTIFGPIWSVLYLLMGVAAWLVWRRSGFNDAGLSLGLFIGQLVLNALWSYLFFGKHRPDLAFFDIVALWSAILVVLILFWRLHRGAGAMLIPYFFWVSFATGILPSSLKKEPESWDSFIKESLKGHCPSPGVALLVAGPSAADPDAQHRVEFIPL